MCGRVIDATTRPKPSHGPPSRPAKAYSVMRWSCAGGMRGGDGSMTSPPMTG